MPWWCMEKPLEANQDVQVRMWSVCPSAHLGPTKQRRGQALAQTAFNKLWSVGHRRPLHVRPRPLGHTHRVRPRCCQSVGTASQLRSVEQMGQSRSVSHTEPDTPGSSRSDGVRCRPPGTDRTCQASQSSRPPDIIQGGALAGEGRGLALGGASFWPGPQVRPTLPSHSLCALP
jgi:hypothetical protein